jgi:hypothetical protein
MTNHDHLVDGLHSILAGLWEGADDTAAAEFRALASWFGRALKSSVPTYRAGTFPAPVTQDAQDLVFLQSAAEGMRQIGAAFNEGDSKQTAQLVKELLATLSERQPA